LTGLCSRKNETWVLTESGGNGIGKKAHRKVENPTEKGINRTSNQLEKKSWRLGQVLGEREREHRGKMRAPQKKKSTEKAIKAILAETVAATSEKCHSKYMTFNINMTFNIKSHFLSFEKLNFIKM